jgi:hypothetical protein
VEPSYGWMITRMESSFSRIQGLLTIASTVTLGVPAFAVSVKRDISLLSPWFVTAALLYVAIVAIGIVARDWGDLVLLDPGKLYRESLHLTEWEFKKDVVYFAGQHFAHNQALANRKATLSRIMSVMFAAEVVTLLIWLGRNLATSVPWALESL